MAGFINVRIPLLVRRAVTMVPALVVLALGINPTDALVLSQVVLSFGIPFALVPARDPDQPPRRDGRPRQPPPDDRGRRSAWPALITRLNVFLIYQQIF